MMISVVLLSVLEIEKKIYQYYGSINDTINDQ